MHMCVFPFCSRPVSVSSRLHLCPAVLVASCELTVVWKHDLWQGSARDFNNDWKERESETEGKKWKKLRCALIKWNLSVKLFVFEHQMCVSPSAPLPYLKQFQYLSPAHLRSISTVDCVTSIMFFFFSLLCHLFCPQHILDCVHCPSSCSSHGKTERTK